MDIETGELLHVVEWAITTKSNDLLQIQRQVSSIEQELNYLVKLKHANLIHYLNMRQQTLDDEKQVYVHILQEYVRGLYTFILVGAFKMTHP